MLKKYRASILEITLAAEVFILLALWHTTGANTTLVLTGTALLIALMNSSYLAYGVSHAIHDIRIKPAEGALLLTILVLALIWHVSYEAIVFIEIFCAFLFYRWDARVPASGAFLCLTLTVFFAIIGQIDFAQQSAIYTYFFLMTAALLRLMQHWGKPISREA